MIKQLTISYSQSPTDAKMMSEEQKLFRYADQSQNFMYTSFRTKIVWERLIVAHNVYPIGQWLQENKIWFLFVILLEITTKLTR